MPRIHLIFLSILLLVACSQARESVPASELAQIDLKTLVIQPGDLPPMDATPQLLLVTYPGTVNSFLQFLGKGDTVKGQILVAIYADINAAEKGYKEDVETFEWMGESGYTRVSPAVGEQSILIYRENDDAFLAFYRCHARVSIGFPPLTERAQAKDRIVEYAQRLDARLTPLVC